MSPLANKNKNIAGLASGTTAGQLRMAQHNARQFAGAGPAARGIGRVGNFKPPLATGVAYNYTAASRQSLDSADDREDNESGPESRPLTLQYQPADNYHEPQPSQVSDNEQEENDDFGGEEEDEGLSLREAKRQSMNEEQANQASGGGSSLNLQKPWQAVGTATVMAFCSLPESMQIEYFLASLPETFGLVIPLWDGFWIWAILKSPVKPKIGFTVVLLFWSLVFWLVVAMAIFLIAMVISFILMGPVDKTIAIWNLGFDALNAISSLFR